MRFVARWSKLTGAGADLSGCSLCAQGYGGPQHERGCQHVSRRAQVRSAGRHAPPCIDVLAWLLPSSLDANMPPLVTCRYAAASGA